jgi:hypothetical protein
MLELIINAANDLNKIIAEELYELPLTSPTTPQTKWYPIYELEEVVVVE